MTYVIFFACITIVVCIISTSLTACLVMHLLKLDKDEWLDVGIVLGTVLGIVVASSVLKPPAKPQDDSRYDQILAAESQEPQEIREYRKQLYLEVGSEILKKKKQIREEVQARAKKTLAEYRKQQEKIALDAEIAKQREKILSLVNEQIKPNLEHDKKHKAVVAEIILLSDVELEVKTDGKVQKFRKAGVYKF